MSTFKNAVRAAVALVVVSGALTACGNKAEQATAPVVEIPASARQRLESRTIPATLDAAGLAQPLQQATLSTKLMATVTAVLVREGDLVHKGQVLLRLDASDLAAKRGQVGAGLAEAEAMQADAERQVERLRKLHADKAAPKVTLEQAEIGLARAQAAVQGARAHGAELDAVGSYAEVRAPFSGRVVRRFVDPGAFAAPGAPLLAVQDDSALRVSAAIAPSASATLARGQELAVTIEGKAARGVVEGVVPASGGSLYTVNVVVQNEDGALYAGGAATLRLPQGTRSALLVPAGALVREGDLVGVRIFGQYGPELRWVRVGAAQGDDVEVLSGLRAGDELLLANAEAR